MHSSFCRGPQSGAVGLCYCLLAIGYWPIAIAIALPISQFARQFAVNYKVQSYINIIIIITDIANYQLVNHRRLAK